MLALLVDTANGLDAFDVPVQVATGTHELRVEWEDEGGILATSSRTVTVGDDTDGDGAIELRTTVRSTSWLAVSTPST